MTETRVKQEYTELLEEWTEAEAVRQRVADRLRTFDGPPALDDPIWDGWDEADELAGSARQAMRSFLAANGQSRRP